MARNLRVMSHNLPPVKSGSIAHAGGGTWAAGTYSFAIGCRWADENGSDDESNIDLHGLWGIRLNPNTGSFVGSYPRGNTWDAEVVTANQKLTFTWTAPPSPMPRPLYYSIYCQALAAFDPTKPASKMIPTGYSNGNIPGHLLTAEVLDDAGYTSTTLADITAFDASAGTIRVQGNLLASLGADTVFVVAGSAAGVNDGSKTSTGCWLDFTGLGVQTVISVASVTTCVASGTISYSLGPCTFGQNSGTLWGCFEYYDLNPAWDDGPGWRDGRISQGYDGRFTRRDSAIGTPISEWVVGYTGVSGSRYGQRRLAMWARQSAPMLWLLDYNETGYYGAWAQYYAYLDSLNCIGNQRLRDGDFWAKFKIQKVVTNGA